MQYVNNRTDYNYSDILVNAKSPVVYYRIRAIELNGEEKYSPTRIIRFSNKIGFAIQTAPNPFTSNFIISYKAVENEMLTQMFNVSGQQTFLKNVTGNSGNNSINVTEAEQLTKGIYEIQISKGYNMISSGKLIKQ